MRTGTEKPFVQLKAYNDEQYNNWTGTVIYEPSLGKIIVMGVTWKC